MISDLFYTINFAFGIAITLVGLIFGFLTISIVIINRQCCTISNLLICNVTAGFILYFIVNFIGCTCGLRSDWFHHQPACAFRGYVFMVSCIVICYSYLAQAISRLFFAVLFKYQFLLTWRTHWFIIIVSWLISIALPILPLFYNHGYVLEEESRYCILTTKIFSTSMYVMTTGFLAPFSMVIIIYAIILYHARQSTRRVTAVATTTITNRSTQNVPLPNFRREVTIMSNMLILIGIFSCGGIPYFTLVLWHHTQIPPPESLYLLAINFISMSTSLMVIALFLVNKEVRECGIRCLRQLC